jgi:hypothetical protein
MSQTTAIVDKLLSNVSNMYVPEGFIADKILPSVVVKESTGKFAKYGTGHLRIYDDLVGGKAEARRVDSIERSNSTYNLLDHSLEGVVTESDLANVETPYNAEADEVIGLTTILQLNKEKAIADVITNDAVITNGDSLAGPDQFNEGATSDPLGVSKSAGDLILDGCGMMPNKIVMSQKVYNCLKYHPQILTQLGFAMNRAGTLSMQDLCKAFDVEEILIGSVAYESAKKGQTSALTQLWGKHMVFMYTPKTAAKYQVSAGYQVKKASRKVSKYDLNNPMGAKGILVLDQYSFELTQVGAMALYKDVIA